MNNQGQRRRVPEILAAALAALLAVFLAVLPGTAQARLERTADHVLVISGGSGAQAWQLRYAINAAASEIKPQLVMAEGGLAWFSHGMWLRRLDTSKGVVTGRWRIPGNITGLKPEGAKVRVDFDDAYSSDQGFHQDLVLDPAAAQIPNNPVNTLLLYRDAITEPQWVLRPLTSNFGSIAPAEAKARLPQIEDAVRRDPVSPWFQVMQAHLMQAAGDDRFVATLKAAVNNPNTDYTELFRISSRLDEIGQVDLAKDAFERAYRDFLSRGFDPRQLTILITRLVLYSVNFDKIPAARRDEMLLRLYRLSPAGEAADLAMELKIQELDEKGQKEARLQQAETVGLSFWVKEWGSLVDKLILLLAGAALSVLAAVIILYVRYRPQRRLDKAAGHRGGFRFMCLEYWDRSDRVRFFLIVLAAWLGLGIQGQLITAIIRVASVPVSLYSGSFAGPTNTWFLENRLPATPQRDLHLALAYQQSGQGDKAESLYRGLPQYAVAWNNLGVMLKEAGKEADARAAFERARQLDPSLSEAALNQGLPAPDLWTTQYQTYFPGKPMLAPPRRQQALEAFQGTTWTGICLRSLGGPFLGSQGLQGLASQGTESSLPVRALPFALTLVLALALALLFLIPVREVTVTAGPRPWIAEALFPGMSPRWSFAGAAVLLLWTYLLVQTLLWWRFGSPYIITFIALPNLARSYGVSGDILRLINPNRLWLYVAPAVLFIANLGIVLSGRRR